MWIEWFWIGKQKKKHNYDSMEYGVKEFGRTDFKKDKEMLRNYKLSDTYLPNL